MKFLRTTGQVLVLLTSMLEAFSLFCDRLKMFLNFRGYRLPLNCCDQPVFSGKTSFTSHGYHWYVLIFTSRSSEDKTIGTR